MEDIVEMFKKDVKSQKLVLGNKEVLQGLKQGTIKKVYHAKNIAQDMRDDIQHYAQLATVEVVEIPLPSDEVGTLCKKPFNVAVIGLIA